LEEWATFEEKLLIFQENTPVPCGKRFSEYARPAYEVEVSTLRLCYNIR
jgi:hypothetical protein